MLRGLDTSARAVAALEDDLRRRMYTFIRSRGRPVSRDEAAAHVGISRKLAAFHLDKLVERGLLAAHYARPPERSSTGAGRSSKLYEPSGIELELSIPERRYDLLGEILVEALEAEPHGSPRDAAKAIAFQKGEAIGKTIRVELRLRSAGTDKAMSLAEQILGELGFEPGRDASGGLSLRNCPFHNLASLAPDLVCGLNREFIEGLLRGLGNRRVDASLEPAEGRCCVRLTAAGS